MNPKLNGNTRIIQEHQNTYFPDASLIAWLEGRDKTASVGGVLFLGWICLTLRMTKKCLD